MRKSGSALILVLWVIGLLSMIVVSFAFDAHLEGKLISSSRRRMKANYYALSGFELAKSFLDHSREITGDETDQEKEEDQRYEQAISLHFGRTVRLSHDFTEADGETVVISHHGTFEEMRLRSLSSSMTLAFRKPALTAFSSASKAASGVAR